jgi:hypothetical protein
LPGVGKVMVAGGVKGDGSGRSEFLATVELYDVAAIKCGCINDSD